MRPIRLQYKSSSRDASSPFVPGRPTQATTMDALPDVVPSRGYVLPQESSKKAAKGVDTAVCS